jgi:2-polyprenyl-3-methyl-5-hydroxy-6-metoxy-1,4-benzoquinol methylase
MARLAEAALYYNSRAAGAWERDLPGIDKSSLERLVPEELLNDEATGLQTFKLHIERYEFAARKLLGTASILDLACGVGYGSRLMKDLIPAATVTGVDACAAAIEYAAVHYSKPGLNFGVDDAMDFDDGPFDAVVSLETIEHLPDPQAFMERVTKRLLRPGGLFIGSVPVTPSMDANPNHLHDFTARSFRKLLAGHGLVELDSLYQVQPYSPLAVITKSEERMQAMRPNIWAYYCRHPQKALRRLGSILTDGFTNKYLTIAAQQPPVGANRIGLS